MLCSHCLPFNLLHVLGAIGSQLGHEGISPLNGGDGRELGAFLGWWPPSAMWAGPLIFHGHHRGCLDNSIFSNLRLGAACWAHFVCHHELWQTPVGHPFSFLNSSWGLTGENITRKLLSLSVDLFLKILLFPVTFLIFFSIAIFRPYFYRLACYCSMWLCCSQRTS